VVHTSYLSRATQSWLRSSKPNGQSPLLDRPVVGNGLDVVSRARREARDNRPSPADTELDFTQREIVARCQEAIDRMRMDAQKRVHDLVSDLVSMRENSRKGDLEAIVQDTAIEAGIRQISSKEEITRARLEERAQLRQLRVFQKDNGLHREAHYPKSSVLHWAIVFSLIAIEAATNSRFFAKASEFGLLGGWLQALVVAFVNIGVSLAAGTVLVRGINYGRAPLKVTFVVLSGLYAAFILLFNLMTAHYRELLDIMPDNALEMTIPKMIGNPWMIDNFDAAVLFAVGILFAVFACWKGYVADDRYPGYGAVQRRYRAAKERYEGALDDLRAKIGALNNTGIARIDQAVAELASKVRTYSEKSTAIGAILREFKADAEHCQRVCHQLLRLYRDENRGVRTLAPPLYFDEYPTMAIDIDTPDGERQRHELTELGRLVDQMGWHATNAKEKLRLGVHQRLEELEGFVRDIEERANLIIRMDEQFMQQVVAERR